MTCLSTALCYEEQTCESSKVLHVGTVCLVTDERSRCRDLNEQLLQAEQSQQLKAAAEQAIADGASQKEVEKAVENQAHQGKSRA